VASEGKWIPSPLQAKVFDAAQKPGVGRTITAICKEAGIDRKTFYRWMTGDPGFKEAWENIWEGSVKRHMPAVIAAMVEKARKGDVNAARLLAEMGGMLKQRVSIGGDDKMPSLKIEIDG